MADRLIASTTGKGLGLTVLGDPAAPHRVVLFAPMPGASGFDPDPTATRRAGVRIASVDRPGYGASAPLPLGELASFARHADDVAHHLRDTSGPHEPLGVIGWGVGALAAAALAGRHPRLVGRLALVDAPAAARPGAVAPPYARADLCVAGDEPALRDRAGLDRRIDRMLSDAALRGGSGFAFDRSALRSRDWSQSLGRIAAPTVLVYGSRHPLVSAAVDGKRLRRRIPHARVIRVPGAAGLAIAQAWERILHHVSG